MPGSELRGLLPPVLLLLLHERPGHGYDLISRLSALGVADVDPGQIYRTLRGLERERSLVSVWVTSASGPARRRYELTAEGLADLEARMAGLSRMDHVLDACLTRWRARQAARRTTQQATRQAPPRAARAAAHRPSGPAASGRAAPR